MIETVTVDGRDAVVRRHHGREPTLVLVHGAGANHHFWDDLLPDIGGLDVVMPSLPGRCGSGGQPRQSVVELASWLRAVVQKLSLHRIVVAGHSLGGAIAIEYALQQKAERGPDLAGVVLLATGARLRVMQPILDAVAAAADSGMPSATSTFEYLPDTDPSLVDRVERSRQKTPGRATVHDWKAANAFDRMKEISQIDVPTLVIGGTADELTPPKYAEYLTEHISGARLELVEGAGHMMPVERTADAGRLVHDFVTDLGDAADAAAQSSEAS